MRSGDMLFGGWRSWVRVVPVRRGSLCTRGQVQLRGGPMWSRGVGGIRHNRECGLSVVDVPRAPAGSVSGRRGSVVR